MRRFRSSVLSVKSESWTRVPFQLLKCFFEFFVFLNFWLGKISKPYQSKERGVTRPTTAHQPVGSHAASKPPSLPPPPPHPLAPSPTQSTFLPSFFVNMSGDSSTRRFFYQSVPQPLYYTYIKLKKNSLIALMITIHMKIKRNTKLVLNI